jgi:hypothetical protein
MRALVPGDYQPVADDCGQDHHDYDDHHDDHHIGYDYDHRRHDDHRDDRTRRRDAGFDAGFG